MKECYECPIGTYGDTLEKKNAVYNMYRGDYESLKLYVGFPTFNLSPKQIDAMETDNIVTCQYCPSGWYTDTKGNKECTTCPKG